MIVAKRLRIEALKHLRGIDLYFPRRGSMLIEGPNESGKSTLFEAIYFALYGRALVGEENRPALVALIPHDRTQARVALTLLAEETELEVTRGLTRGRSGAVTSEAALVVRRPGAPEERVSGSSAVTARIEQELRGIDYDTFRNSLFMEQKALERIEALPRENRDKAISRLLGLERLTQVERLVAPPAELLERAKTLRARLAVAQRRAVARDASERASDAEARVRVAELRVAINRRDRLGAERATLDRREAELLAERASAQKRLADLDAVAALERRLVAAGALRWAAINAQREEERLATRLADLSGAERLPEARRRLDEISALEGRLARALDHQRRITVALEASRRIRRAEEALAEQRAASMTVEREQASARDALLQARLHDALGGWIQARAALDLRSDGNQQLTGLRADREGLEVGVAVSRAESRHWLIATASAGAVTLLALVLALVPHLGWFWLLVVVGLVATGATGYQWRRRMTELRTREWRVAGVDGEITTMLAETNLSRRLGGVHLDRYEAGLRAAGEPIPDSQEQARTRLAALEPLGDLFELEEAGREADAIAARARFDEERIAAEMEQAREDWARIQAREGLSGDPQTTGQLDEIESDLEAITAEAERLGAPADLAGLAAARGAADAMVNSLMSDAGNVGEVTTRLDTTRVLVASARDEWAAALNAIGADATAAGLDAPPKLRGKTSVADLEDRQDMLAALLAERLGGDDEPALRARDGATGAELESIATLRATAEGKQALLTSTIQETLAGLGIEARGDEPPETLAARVPELRETQTLDTMEMVALRVVRDAAGREAYHAQQVSVERAREAQVEETELDGDALLAELESVEREIRQRELAGRLAAETRARVIRRALPETEAYMRAILPALTLGRYRDVSLLREDAQTAHGGVDLTIRMWDDMAGRYVRKNLFSGGARDQASLALRLAFALATLPRGGGGVTGFLLLPPPTGALDPAARARRRARLHLPR
jgi:hypothetical protein